MSNHSGSYMLHRVLVLLDRMGIAEKMEKEERNEFIKNIIKIGNSEDCNPGEILDEIGEKYGICYGCLEEATDFEDGLCPTCRNET